MGMRPSVFSHLTIYYELVFRGQVDPGKVTGPDCYTKSGDHSEACTIVPDRGDAQPDLIIHPVNAQSILPIKAEMIFFVGFDLFARLIKLSFNTSIITNIYGFRIAPRYEDNAFGAYLPLEYASKQNFNAGLAFRWKAFIVGSDNILSRWFYKDQAVDDIYVSFKVPLLKEQYQYPRRLHDMRQVKKETKRPND